MDEQVVAGVLHEVGVGHRVAGGPLVATVFVSRPSEPVVAGVRGDDLLHHPRPDALHLVAVYDVRELEGVAARTDGDGRRRTGHSWMVRR